MAILITPSMSKVMRKFETFEAMKKAQEKPEEFVSTTESSEIEVENTVKPIKMNRLVTKMESDAPLSNMI